MESIYRIHSSDSTYIDGPPRVPRRRRWLQIIFRGSQTKRNRPFEVSETYRSSFCQSDRSATHCRAPNELVLYAHWSSYTIVYYKSPRIYAAAAVCVRASIFNCVKAAYFEQVIRNSGSAPRCCCFCRRSRRFDSEPTPLRTRH